MTTYLNIAGYQFITLTDLPALQRQLLAKCSELQLKGTILLSLEGININLAGTPADAQAFQRFLQTFDAFAAISFHETYSSFIPFNVLKVKIKPEIITFKHPTGAVPERAPHVPPTVLKEWLDEKRDMTLLDTRNNYEVQFGTFKGAVDLALNDFSELPDSIAELDRKKPIVMFCTGGIRCEKAAHHMIQAGFEEVYQLDSGILGYFAQVGGEHYEGECFVFDKRIAVDATLTPTGTMQCQHCMGPIPAESDCARCA